MASESRPVPPSSTVRRPSTPAVSSFESAETASSADPAPGRAPERRARAGASSLRRAASRPASYDSQSSSRTRSVTLAEVSSSSSATRFASRDIPRAVSPVTIMRRDSPDRFRMDDSRALAIKSRFASSSASSGDPPFPYPYRYPSSCLTRSGSTEVQDCRANAILHTAMANHTRDCPFKNLYILHSRKFHLKSGNAVVMDECSRGMSTKLPGFVKILQRFTSKPPDGMEQSVKND